MPANLRMKQEPDCWSGVKTNGKFASSDAMRSQLLYTWLQVLDGDKMHNIVAVEVMKHGNGNW